MISRQLPPTRFLLCVALAALATACASNPTSATREFLDTATGVTVTSSRAPIVLYRDNPAAAAYARNVIHMGPIEVNRSGNYRYFLWVGIWNTMQPAGTDTSRDGFETIVIVVDGEPMTLELAGWTPAAIGTSAPVYSKPVASAADAYYPVTIDQLRFIAEGRDISLRTTGTSKREFALWSAQNEAREGLFTFLDSVGY